MEKINDQRCVLIEKAVSDKNGTTFLNLSGGYNPGRFVNIYPLLKLFKLTKALAKKDDWDLSSSIKPSISNSRQYPWLTFGEKVETQTINLDTFTKENNIKSIDWIWCDIQGSEGDMINGAKETLKFARYLYIEYGEGVCYEGALTREQTIFLLNNHDFELIEKYSSKKSIGNLLFKNTKIAV